MNKNLLWEAYKSKVSNCSFRNGKICDICEKEFEDNEYCMCSALNYGGLENVIFECEKCFTGKCCKTLYEGFYCKTCNSCENTILLLGKESFDKNQLVYYCKKCNRNWI